jgi:F-type H+-transporting ATPase subunit alpha
VEIQSAILWTVQNGFFDDVPVDKVKDFQTKLTDYLQNRKADLIGRITKEKAMSDSIVGDLKAAITEFKQTYR